MNFIDILNNYIFEDTKKIAPPLYDSNSWYKIEFKNRDKEKSKTNLLTIYLKLSESNYKKLIDYYNTELTSNPQIYKKLDAPSNKKDIYTIEYINDKDKDTKVYVYISDLYFKKLQDKFIDNSIENSQYNIEKLDDIEEIIDIIKKKYPTIHNIEGSNILVDKIINQIKQNKASKKIIKKSNKIITLSPRKDSDDIVLQKNKEKVNDFYDTINFKYPALLKAHKDYRESMSKTKTKEEKEKYKDKRDRLIIDLVYKIKDFTEDTDEQESIIEDIVINKIPSSYNLLSKVIQKFYVNFKDQPINKQDTKIKDEPKKTKIKSNKKLYKVTTIDKQGEKVEDFESLTDDEYKLYEPYIIANANKYLENKKKAEEEIKKMEKDPSYNPKIPSYGENIVDRIIGLELVKNKKISEMSGTGGGAAPGTGATANYGSGEGMASKYAFAPTKKTKINESYDLSKKYKKLFKKEL